MQYSFSRLRTSHEGSGAVVRFGMQDSSGKDATMEAAKKLAPLEQLAPFADHIIGANDLFEPGGMYRIGQNANVIMSTQKGDNGTWEIVLQHDARASRATENAECQSLRGIGDIMHEKGLIGEEGRAQFLRSVTEGCATGKPPAAKVR
jgi:hypothetical protein